MTRFPAHLRRPGTLALAATLALATTGCGTIGDLFSGDKVDYRNAQVKSQPLEVPPDLSQLARESRYQPQGGVVSAAAAASTPLPAAIAGGAPVAGAQTVALNSLGAMRVEREGQMRWLVVPLTPEQLWPQLRSFWQDRGFTLTEDNATAGVMETNWSENRAKVNAEAARNFLGRMLNSVYDSGERDRYRTRVERNAAGGSEIYITHRGIEEVYANGMRDSTVWRARPGDPQLEAEFLTRLMVSLGAKDEPARAAVVAAAPAPAPVPAPGAKPVAAAAPAVPTGLTSITVNEPFDRAWRRVGLALDRTGFTVEDRDRAAGLYYVRYVDPKNAGKEEPGWWARLWGDKTNPQEALRYRVLVKTAEQKTTVSIQSSGGAAETGDNAQRILGLLSNELR